MSARNIHKIISSRFQTKKWRMSQDWYRDGKRNECEKYQIRSIEYLLGKSPGKTYHRINMETNNIEENKKPLEKNNGYEWTENFDGIIKGRDNIYYFNLKFVCDKGGAQTRTLREVYHFIKYQHQYIKNHNTTNVHFINILDGDTCYENMGKFNYLRESDKYIDVKKYMFIGSMYDFESSQVATHLKTEMEPQLNLEEKTGSKSDSTPHSDLKSKSKSKPESTPQSDLKSKTKSESTPHSDLKSKSKAKSVSVPKIKSKSQSKKTIIK